MSDSQSAPRAATNRAEFHLAIVGGCLSHQRGIPFNALYHRLLARDVERETMALRIHIARSFDADYTGRLDELRQRVALDGVLLHVRVMVTRRSRLVVSGRHIHRGRYRLHPALFTRAHDGAAIEALRASEAAAQRRRRPDRRAGRAVGGGTVRRSLRSLNSALGALVGLDRWAVDDEMLRLGQFVARCRAIGLPLFVLGPTPLGEAGWQSRTIRLLNERLRTFCRASEIPFALIETDRDGAGDPILMADGIHLSPAGHALVAARLKGAGIAGWMRRAAA